MHAECGGTGTCGWFGVVLGVNQPNDIPVGVFLLEVVANDPGAVSASFSAKIAEDDFPFFYGENPESVE
jgi:hypothetical protein